MQEKLLEPKYKEWIDLNLPVDEFGNNVLFFAKTVEVAKLLIKSGAAPGKFRLIVSLSLPISFASLSLADQIDHVNKKGQSLLFNSRLTQDLYEFIHAEIKLPIEHQGMS